MNWTREQYIPEGNNRPECSHSEYYGQFVDEAVIDRVIDHFTKEVILASNHKVHFNDIPLEHWDELGLSIETMKKVEINGEYLTLSTMVCINKEAARQFVEANQ
jgi:hypothetical protein